MLVRTSVWRDLDGLDPAVPVFRDGVEFGWRAHLNGYRVVTTPDAEMTHRQVGRAGLRPRGLAGRHPGALDRLLGMTVVAGHAPARALPLVWLRLVLSCLLLALGYLLGKAPGRSRDELAAAWSFVVHPGRLRALRSRTASIDPAPGTAEVVRSLRPPWWSSLRIVGETLGGALSERYVSVAGEVDSASIDELTDRRVQLGGRRATAAPVAAPRRPCSSLGRRAGLVRRGPRAVRDRFARRARAAARVRLARRPLGRRLAPDPRARRARCRRRGSP